MKRLCKFFRLPFNERWLLVKTAFLLETIKLGMWLFPFRFLHRILTQVMEASTRLQREPLSEEKIARSVELVSRHTPGLKTCLNQALAVQVLLARRGHPALLHIGVLKSVEKQFQAHAWVESGGIVFIGGFELDRYKPLAVLDTKGCTTTAGYEPTSTGLPAPIPDRASACGQTAFSGRRFKTR